MGLLRFILAAGVLLDHTGGVFGYVIAGGPASVQGFYVVSGFFMTMVLNEKYDTNAKNTLFYTNRMLRIFSVYWTVLITAVLIYAITSSGAYQLIRKIGPDLSVGTASYLIFSNVFLFGIDISMFLGLHEGRLALEPFTASPMPRVYQFMVIPQAWSLGLELAFYVLAPFIVRRSWKLVAVLVGTGLAVRTVGFTYGLDGDPWAYRFFPFELSTFLLGTLAYRLYQARRHSQAGWERSLGLGTLILVLAFPLYGADGGSFFQIGRIVLIAGIAIGLPFLYKWSRHLAWDRALGDLSYPLYLCHLAIAGVVARLPVFSGPTTRYSLAVLVGSVAFAAVIARYVEAPLDEYRQRRIRGFASAA